MIQRFIKCFVITFVLASLPLLSFSCTHVPAGKIAFVSTREDPEHGVLSIYVMNPDGSNQTKVGPQVTKHGPFVSAGPGRGFLWSPNGTQVAFHTSEISPPHHWLWTVNADGTNLTKVTEINPGYIYGTSWSPDGRRIVFGFFDGYTCDIYTLDLDTSELKNLTATSAIEEAWPSWSPDGKKIVFTIGGWRPTDDEWVSTDDIYIMDADGSNVTNLTGNTPSDDFYCLWSPR